MKKLKENNFDFSLLKVWWSTFTRQGEAFLSQWSNCRIIRTLVGEHHSILQAARDIVHQKNLCLGPFFQGERPCNQGNSEGTQALWWYHLLIGAVLAAEN